MDEVWPHGVPQPGSHASHTRDVTVDDIVRFTEISGDRNPLHYDAELAGSTRFGGIVVQGGVTTAILNAVVAEDLPGPGSVFLQLDLSFLAPVRPGDTITGEVTVTSARTDKPVCELDVAVVRRDGTRAVEGRAVTYTVPLPRPTTNGHHLAGATAVLGADRATTSTSPGTPRQTPPDGSG